jgi:hypothetical protein
MAPYFLISRKKRELREISPKVRNATPIPGSKLVGVV